MVAQSIVNEFCRSGDIDTSVATVRDAPVLLIGEGTSKIQRVVIGLVGVSSPCGGYLSSPRLRGRWPA
jgi:hypothetical protein